MSTITLNSQPITLNSQSLSNISTRNNFYRREISRLHRKLNRIFNGNIINIESFDSIIKINERLKSLEFFSNNTSLGVSNVQYNRLYLKALRNYMIFHENNVNIDLSKITYNNIAKSSAGISGWANANFDL
tara:strand:+ start:11257 stop:11649 length:393 start_codon:yes stop_codon:yes gene_type:complete